MSCEWMVTVGDCRVVMAAMDAESVDAIVCDPPYGLEFMGKDWDAPWKSGEVVTVTDEATNGTFFSKGFKHGVRFSRGRQEMLAYQEWFETVAVEALRVLKPGGHLLAFGGTRTFHRMTVAIEDAGFEVRDCLSWLYGSGFPKSLNVGKAIDKAGGGEGMPANDRVSFAKELRVARESHRMSRDDLAAWFPQYSEVTRNWERLDAGFRVPSETDYSVLVERLGVSESWRLRVQMEDKRRLVSDDGTDRRDDGTVIGLGHAGNKWEATTDAAARWEGWGTALKPAWEPIVMARKPLCGTVAGNVLAHGTGGLNIDGSRIGMPCEVKPQVRPTSDDSGASWSKGDHTPFHYPAGGGGRWPANVLLDEGAAAALDEQSGVSKSGAAGKKGSSGFVNGYDGDYEVPYGDSGGASRFFYVAKASRRDRNEGLDGMPEKRTKSFEGGPIVSAKHPGTSDGGSRVGANHHPTVKPTALMRHLVRLVTPPGGLVLDPFTGSGSTGKAAVLEGFRFHGIEQDAEYAEIARARIAWAEQQVDGKQPTLM